MHQHGGGNRTTEIGYKEKKIFIVYRYLKSGSMGMESPVSTESFSH